MHRRSLVVVLQRRSHAAAYGALRAAIAPRNSLRPRRVVVGRHSLGIDVGRTESPTSSLALHPAIDWQSLSNRGPAASVSVRCPDCPAPRVLRVESLRRAAWLGQFTGRCRRHSEKRPATYPAHPLVDWPSLAHGIVLVRCAGCEVPRWLPAKEVRRQMRAGTFTGACTRHHRAVMARTQAHPPHPGVEWARSEFIADPSEPWRWRAAVPVICPECGRERRLLARYVARRIAAGDFDGSCPQHRPVARRAAPSAPAI